MLLLLPLIAGAAQPTKRPTDAVRGEQLYRRHCVACHGVRNGGKGPATQALVHPVPPLQGKTETSEAHVQSVLRGKGAMPAFEASFDRQDAVRVLKYMRSLGPDKSLPATPTRKTPEKKPPIIKGGEKTAVPPGPKAPAKPEPTPSPK